MSVLTPMQRQYFEIKKSCRDDVLLFFRLGDFYELFYEDAEIASKELGLTLTARHKNSEKKMPMCGLPYHAADKYIARLTRAGFSVAICEQVSDASLPGIVKREVVQIITPGTTLQEAVLDDKSNNYIAAIVRDGDSFALAFADVSTGEFLVHDCDGRESFLEEIFRFRPSEILLSEVLFEDADFVSSLREHSKTISKHMIPSDSRRFLQDYFGMKTLSAFDVKDSSLLIRVSALLLSYVSDTQKATLTHIQGIQRYYSDGYMHLDPQSIRNLEIFASIQESSLEGSLLAVIDNVFTAVGARQLRSMLARPLVDVKRIQRRLNLVDVFVMKKDLLDAMNALKDFKDIARMLARLSCNRGNPRDFVGIRVSLLSLITLSRVFIKGQHEWIDDFLDVITSKEFDEIVSLISDSISDDPPMLLSSGGIIRDGYSEELDEWRQISNGGKEWLKRFEEEEKKKTRIATLKVGFNRVFGYYIEISKGQSSAAPEHYIRKQTLANAERYIVPELKKYEDKVLEAEDKILQLETQFFQEVRLKLVEHASCIQRISSLVARLDVFSCFARNALKYAYVKPEMCDGIEMYVVKGRHPVVEGLLPSGERFVPNDTHMGRNADSSDDQPNFILLTGPNMAGKSTYLRQCALISLMAQIGSYVPAEFARLGLVDRIYTRIGASDNVSRGQSTFMVEMQETAHILHHATDKSLIILDEIGRGTSTYDGLALASAIFEYIHDKIRAKTLFATHYHELIELAEQKSHAKNYSVSVVEKGSEVIFLHSLVEGGADKSYGIEVAKIAGIPEEITKRAQDILSDLEINSSNSIQASLPLVSSADSSDKRVCYEKIVKDLRELSLNEMRPIDALQKLDELKKRVIRNEY